MHELKRRAYLDAMGITTYVSRGQLPGAAPSRKLVVARLPAVPDAVKRMPGIDLGSKPELSPKPPAAGLVKAIDASVEFSIAAFSTGNWLWLEQLPPQQALMSNQVLLVQAMALALGWGAGKPDVEQFNWPIHSNSQLDLGEEAARASLGGFVSRKLERKGCRGFVLLGSACQHWLPEGQFGAGVCVRTVSTSEMLHNPPLKKQAWRDLLPYAD